MAKSSVDVLEKLRSSKIPSNVDYALSVQAGGNLVSPYAAYQEVHIYVSNRKAIEHFEKALRATEVPEDSVAVITYLVGELYRRIGEESYAHLWFDRVPEVAGQNPKAQWVIDLALQQKTDPKETL